MFFSKKKDKELLETNDVVVDTAPEVKVEAEKSEDTTYEKYKHIDWRRVSEEKIFQVMAEVMLENKKLATENKRLQEEIIEAYNSNGGKDYSKDNLEKLAYKVAPNLIIEMNKGVKYSALEMVDKIVKEVLEDRQKRLTKILELTEMVKSHKELLEELKQQHYEMLTKQNEAVFKDKGEELPKSFNEETFKKLTTDNIGSEPRQAKAILKMIPLDDARATFTTPDYLEVARIIGETGISEFQEILKLAKEKEISSNRFETIITNLEKKEIIRVEKVTTFAKNTGIRCVKFDEIGERLFREIFKKEPVQAEMDKLRQENDNYNHGYSIKEVALSLGELYGYEKISMDRAKNTIKVSDDGKITWIPDIIAINKFTGKREYFEVETGKHRKEDFEYKLDKALYVANELTIVTNNRANAEMMLAEVRNWYNKKKSKPHLVVKIFSWTTFTRKEEPFVFPNEIETLENLAEDTLGKDANKLIEVKKEENPKKAPLQRGKNGKFLKRSESIGDDDV